MHFSINTWFFSRLFSILPFMILNAHSDWTWHIGHWKYLLTSIKSRHEAVPFWTCSAALGGRPAPASGLPSNPSHPKFWTVRSRLYRSRVFEPNGHFWFVSIVGNPSSLMHRPNRIFHRCFCQKLLHMWWILCCCEIPQDQPKPGEIMQYFSKL